MIPSDPPALVQIDATPITTQTQSIAPIPSSPSEEESPQNEFKGEILSLFDAEFLLDDKSNTSISPPTIEMKRCKLSPSRLVLGKAGLFYVYFKS